MEKITYAIVMIFAVAVCVDAHGRLLLPPSRSSMWRYKDTDPMLKPFASIIQSNYNDNELFCGGRQTQIDNGGKCGVCGDAYDALVKDNEAGGKYALGIITRNYQRGQSIEVTVELTAEHKGYFEFRLCPWNNVDVPITHECLDRHLLDIEKGGPRWYLPEDHDQAQATHVLSVKLPEDVTCQQCVLQWRYHTGNSWGVDEEGEGLGYGDQEEFYGCSDIAILNDGSDPPTTTTKSPTSTSTEVVATSTSNSAPQSSTTTNAPATGISLSTTTVAPPPTTTSSRPHISEPVSEIDCATTQRNLPVFRDCNSFYICAHSDQAPFTFMCAEGTVCDMYDGRCKHPYQVPYPCGTRP